MTLMTATTRLRKTSRQLLLTAVAAGALFSPAHASEIDSIAANNNTARLVSTDAGASELILALGLGPQLVAVDVTTTLPADYPMLANVGYHRNLSAEGLLSLEPSAIVGSEHMGPKPAVDAVERAGVPLVRLPPADSGEQLLKNINTLAAALGEQSRGQTLQKTLQTRLKKLQQQSLSGQRIAFLLSMDSASLRLAGGGSGGDTLIALLGGSNVAGFKNYQTVSTEALLSMQPDIILVAGRDPSKIVGELLQAQPMLKFSDAAGAEKMLAVDGSTLVAGLSLAAVDEALRLSARLQSNTLVSTKN